MLELFDRIPVHDLVRLNGLVSWWSGYVTKVCRTKRDITVQCGDKSIRYITGDVTQGDTQDQFNLLKVTTIDSNISERLGQLLPSITSLEIIIDGPINPSLIHNYQSFSFADITYLISQWSHQLVSLKIKCYPYYSPIGHETIWANDEKQLAQIKQLLHSLNDITTLRRLSIDCGKSWQCTPMWDLIELPILSQLEYLYCCIGHARQHDILTLRHSLVRYAAPNQDLNQIELPSLIWLHERNDLFKERQLLSKFTMLKLEERNHFTREQWALFPNLVTFHLGYLSNRTSFMQLITDMQRLNHVRNLKMHFLVIDDIDRQLVQVADNLPQLPSITNLKIKFTADRSIDWFSFFKSLQLSLKMFPNVESVRLDYSFVTIMYRGRESSYRVVKLMAKIWLKIRIQMLKRHIRRQFPGVECTF